MGAGKAAEADTGLRIVLEGGRSLAIGKSRLDVYDPALKKINRSSVVPLNGASAGQQSIPLYNVLWAEVSGGKLSIEYAAQPSKTIVKLEKLVYAIPPSEPEPAGPSPEAFASSLVSRAYGESQLRRRAYILINPSSGRGGGVRKWETEVKPLFEAARMEMDVVTLSKGGEATELAKTVDAGKYDTIVACSGDGTLHEIFNGLAKRPDAGTALATIAVSHVPCGSGNAMALNLYGSNRPAVAALAIIKGIVIPLDLVSVTQGSDRVISFLSQGVGIIAESDLGTENLRWMGPRRFEVGVLMRLFQRKCYPCDLAVKVEVDDKAQIKAQYKRHAIETQLSMTRANGSSGVNGGNDANGASSANGADSADSADGANGANGEDGANSANEDVGLPPLKYGTVEDKLPEGWELISYDKIGNFYCGNMATIAPDINYFPAAAASDGCMDLITINGNLDPITASKIFMSIGNGTFFDSPQVSYRKVSAYRIVPRDQKDGYISIDGERVPFAPFQAEVQHGLGRVISKGNIYEAQGPPNWEKVSLDNIHVGQGKNLA